MIACDDIEQLAQEVSDLTGAALPDRSLALAEEAVRDPTLYFVGLIGGKDVGKTSLVNALVGRVLSEPIGFGRGTDQVIAYCHASNETSVRKRLAPMLAGKLRVITHDNGELAGQVLLDLPDIDSVYEQHVAMTRQMLQHMLFPMWVQSVEKYADAAPRRLLQQVAAGNDPSNFVFVLNKVDQVEACEGPGVVEELRRDYANRLADALSLSKPPRVYAVSAVDPDRFDLPELRQAWLSRSRSPEMVKVAAQQATGRHEQTLLRWIDQQQLDRRLSSLESLADETDRLIDSEVVVPILAETVPAVLKSASFRWSITEDASRSRLAHWPIVRVLDALLYPLTGLVRRNVSPGEADVNVMPFAERVQSVFLRLEQSHPSLSELYAPRRPWESPEAEQAIAELQRNLSSGIRLLREQVAATATRGSRFTATFRWLLTVGAAAWFPFIQPLLEIVLTNNLRTITPDLLIWIVRVLGAGYLLQSVGFLAMWYLALWACIRFGTHRRVGTTLDRFLSRNDETGPAAIVRAWSARLLGPIHSAKDSLSSLIERIERERRRLDERQQAARAA